MIAKTSEENTKKELTTALTAVAALLHNDMVRELVHVAGRMLAPDYNMQPNPIESVKKTKPIAVERIIVEEVLKEEVQKNRVVKKQRKKKARKKREEISQSNPVILDGVTYGCFQDLMTAYGVDFIADRGEYMKRYHDYHKRHMTISQTLAGLSLVQKAPSTLIENHFENGDEAYKERKRQKQMGAVIRRSNGIPRTQSILGGREVR